MHAQQKPLLIFRFFSFKQKLLRMPEMFASEEVTDKEDI